MQLVCRQLGMTAMPSQATLMRATCVEVAVAEALTACGQALIKQHGLPANSRLLG